MIPYLSGVVANLQWRLMRPALIPLPATAAEQRPCLLKPLGAIITPPPPASARAMHSRGAHATQERGDGQRPAQHLHPGPAPPPPLPEQYLTPAYVHEGFTSATATASAVEFVSASTTTTIRPEYAHEVTQLKTEFATSPEDPLGTPSHDPIDTTRLDPLAQTVAAGLLTHARGDSWAIDAASRNLRPDPEDRTMGNPEGLGMLDGVGSATGTKRFFENGGKQGQGMI